MLTSRKLCLVIAYVSVSAVAASHCAPKGTCLRFSDCDNGLTCTDGLCVAPAGSSDADGGDAGDTSDASEDAVGDTALVDSSPEAVADAGASSDAGKDAAGASTTDASSDAGAHDALDAGGDAADADGVD